MTDLGVNPGTLEHLASTASSLKRSFEDLPHRADETSSYWGHHKVKDAMHDFATNWSYHRKILSEQIGSVGEKAEKALEAFREADRKLAEQAPKDDK